MAERKVKPLLKTMLLKTSSLIKKSEIVNMTGLKYISRISSKTTNILLRFSIIKLLRTLQ